MILTCSLEPVRAQLVVERSPADLEKANIVKNAVEAAGSPSLVEIVVLAKDGHCDVSVIDEGPGLTARELERAFDDFFTTKETGTGLGLPFAKRVMLAHGGDVELSSERGRGTTAIVRLSR